MNRCRCCELDLLGFQAHLKGNYPVDNNLVASTVSGTTNALQEDAGNEASVVTSTTATYWLLTVGDNSTKTH